MDKKNSNKPPAGQVPKLPSLNKNAKIHKRPLNRGQVFNRGGATLSSKQPIIYVGAHSPFMGIVNKVRRALDKSPSSRSTKGLPLAARMAALNSPASSDRLGDEVLVRATGRAMALALHLVAWFSKQNDYKVSVRTMSLDTVDDVVVDDDDGADAEGGFAAEEESRTRILSCLEIGIGSC